MNPSSQREEELFFAASKITVPSDQRAFLEQSCEGDPELLKRMEALLASSHEADRFFAETSATFGLEGGEAPGAKQSSPAAGPDLEPIEDFPNSCIGRYKLIEKIGEGGCGLVYLAEQEEPVQRRVALKIIRRGMESRSVIARFEAERQALAIMDHPNIARVFDAGETDKGSPYFVMELVRGVRITEYCDQNLFSIRQRLELFIQVCHAIQHAHQKGIIHRDIKPSNIVVALHDGVPIPKVIDFGIAKATEIRLSSNLSSFDAAQLIGTPAYMSPEQFEMGWMDIDTRSDIYSLGVLLYELLTGTTPHDTKQLLQQGIDEFRKAMREQEAPRASQKFAQLPAEVLQLVTRRRMIAPRKLASLLHSDLDWVLMKALQKDRSRRYETANGFATDIQRYLDAEAVVARPHSWIYQVQKMVRRNRAVFAAIGAVAATLVIGMGTSTWLFLKERKAHQRAIGAEQQQARLRHEAEVREKVAQAALYVSLERYEEADKQLSGITLLQPTVEGAAVLRSLGEWHSLYNRPKLACDRFAQLLLVNQLDGWDVTTLDALRLGPELLEMGDIKGYERFRDEIIARYSSSNIKATDRIVKISLLQPVDENTIRSLAPIVEQNKKNTIEAYASGDAFQSAWRSLSHSLWEYRLGKHQEAINWATRCLSSSDYNPPRMAAARGILAMAHFHLGQRTEARAEFAKGLELVDTKYRNRLDRGTPVQGFWFDWAFSRLLLREAAGLLGESVRP